MSPGVRSARDLRLFLELLEEIDPREPQRFGDALPVLANAIEADVVGVHTFRRRVDGPIVDHAESTSAGVHQKLLETINGMPPEQRREAYNFDPDRPARFQRNRAHTVESIARIVGDQAHRSFNAARLVPALGLKVGTHVRTLVCDGSVLLGVVYSFQKAPVTNAHVRRMDALVPALQARFRQQNLWASAGWARRALDAVLESVDRPVFVVSASGAIVHANRAGLALYTRETRTLRAELVASTLCAGTPRFDVSRLVGEGAPFYLVSLRSPVMDRRKARVELWSRSHALPPRTSEILGLIVAGLANKDIAVRAKRSLRAVERDVTFLLEAAGVASRSELIRAVLGDAPGSP